MAAGSHEPGRERRLMARPEPSRGTVAGRVGVRGAAADVRGGTYRPRRSSGGRWRGLLFLLVLAAAVLVAGVTLGGPAIGRFALGMAQSNPDSLRMPFMADLVKGQIGDRLRAPAGTDATPVEFVISPGASAKQVGEDLVREGLVSERFLFEYLIVSRNLTGKLQAGVYTMNRTMTPEQVVDRLAGAPDPPPTTVAIDLREGLRIEQITAKLLTLEIETDIDQFYSLATDPPDELRRDYPFLETLPEGRSLEGYLAGGVFVVEPTVSAEELLRMLLDKWQANIGQAPIDAARKADKDFYEVLVLASIVEKEAALDEERALIAGVYANRLERRMTLDADPTVFYAYDSAQLGKLDRAEWINYAFNTPPKGQSLREIEVPEELSGYHSYLVRGLIPGPICSPTLASIRAALNPDTSKGYLFFVAKNDGSRGHAFARTLREHEANIARYQK